MKLRILPIVFLLVVSSAWGQDRIRYLDKTTRKEQTATGSIEEETPGKVMYKLSGGVGTKEIPAGDIVDIVYEVAPGVKLDYGRGGADERKADTAVKDADRKKALSDAIKDYQDVLPRLTDDKYKFARRHVQYKIARLQARQAEADPAEVDGAIEALKKFNRDHGDGWQLASSSRFLARLQLARGDTAGAQKTYEALAAARGISKEAKSEAELQVAEAMIEGKQFPEAQQKLEALLAGATGDDPQSVRIKVYLAQCRGASGKLDEAVKQLEDMIAKTPDKDLKAIAYNALGDCYRINGKTKEALWPYLWVDVVYHQNKQEHQKAMEQLASLFEKLGDKARETQYRERLKREAK
jgi:predicted negative regulator of RcsB-dependent stress response